MRYLIFIFLVGFSGYCLGEEDPAPTAGSVVPQVQDTAETKSPAPEEDTEILEKLAIQQADAMESLKRIKTQLLEIKDPEALIKQAELVADMILSRISEAKKIQNTAKELGDTETAEQVTYLMESWETELKIIRIVDDTIELENSLKELITETSMLMKNMPPELAEEKKLQQQAKILHGQAIRFYTEAQLLMNQVKPFAREATTTWLIQDIEASGAAWMVAAKEKAQTIIDEMEFSLPSAADKMEQITDEMDDYVFDLFDDADELSDDEKALKTAVRTVREGVYELLDMADYIKRDAVRLAR